MFDGGLKMVGSSLSRDAQTLLVDCVGQSGTNMSFVRLTGKDRYQWWKLDHAIRTGELEFRIESYQWSPTSTLWLKLQRKNYQYSLLSG